MSETVLVHIANTRHKLYNYLYVRCLPFSYELREAYRVVEDAPVVTCFECLTAEAYSAPCELFVQRKEER